MDVDAVLAAYPALRPGLQQRGLRTSSPFYLPFLPICSPAIIAVSWPRCSKSQPALGVFAIAFAIDAIHVALYGEQVSQLVVTIEILKEYPFFVRVLFAIF